jgi:CheY-like chemotaxis protein
MTDVVSVPNLKPTTRPRKRLLLVDDNAEGRRALARLLELYGYEVTAVADGTSALEVLRGTPPPEVLLTDLFLPDLDGRDIARMARDLAPAVTVVMITGWDFGADVPTREETGVDLLFLKPVNVGELVSKLNELRQDRA